MDEIYLVDGSCFVYRAYHAIKKLTTSKGIPTNAIYGFTRIILKLIKERKVEYMLIAFDSPQPTERHRIYEEYKITRPETPKDLPLQIDYIKQIIDAFGIKRIEIPGYEADDIIATVTEKLSSESSIIIVSLDKDMVQLVSEKVRIYDPFNDLLIDRDFVVSKYGIPPEKITDFMALVGDSIDNIPGVKGIGEKTASDILKRYGSVENILRNIDIIKPSKVAEVIKQNLNALKLSKELVVLKKDLPVDFSKEDLKIKSSENALLTQIFVELEFNSLLKEIVSSKETVEQVVIAKNDVSVAKQIKEGKIKEFAFSLINEKPFVGFDGSVYEVAPSELSLILSAPALKIVYDAKQLLRQLSKYHAKIKAPYFDLMLAAYLLNPNKGKYSFNDLAFEHLGKLYSATGEDITRIPLMLELYEKLSRQIKEMALEKTYFEIEIPLVEILFEMEQWGIKVDEQKLDSLTKHLSIEIEKIREKIYALAGVKFNINSPKQLAEVLYDRLGLKTRKRGKKARSTEMEVLEELAVKHEIAQEIINYRILNKLLTGYLIPLKTYINPETGRIHTKWSQTVAATGRLASSEPNLQNIPVKGYWAQLLREIFIPEDGYLFLSADYSQIELRLLAHLSEDPALIRAFKEGKDIHTTTASEIFSVDEVEVTEDHRRIAKTVNFGIAYGISPYGLSESIKIPFERAQELIDLYFLRYPKVSKFIEDTICFAKEHGYVRTAFGRIRPIPEINSPNQFLRLQAERMAVNAVVQGTAADIIKMAMIRIHKKSAESKIDARMILQIHDEIVFEVKEADIERLAKIVQAEMKDFPLNVPLEVNIYTGKTLNL